MNHIVLQRHLNTHFRTETVTIKCKLCKGSDVFSSAVDCAKHVYDTHETIIVSYIFSAVRSCLYLCTSKYRQLPSAVCIYCIVHSCSANTWVVAIVPLKVLWLLWYIYTYFTRLWYCILNMYVIWLTVIVFVQSFLAVLNVKLYGFNLVLVDKWRYCCKYNVLQLCDSCFTEIEPDNCVSDDPKRIYCSNCAEKAEPG